jgi:serine/threonine-protein phosphatase 2A regulatory subunit B
MTGSYSNNFSIYNRETSDEITLQADKSAFKAKRLGSTKNKLTSGRNGKRDDVDPVDFNKKILHASWHPKDNIIAVAATNNLFIFAYVLSSIY